MFFAERWAEAFINASGAFINASGACVNASGVNGGTAVAGGGLAAENAGEGLAVLRAVLPLVRGIPGEVSGRAAAFRLEKMLRTAAAGSGESPGLEASIRLLVLLVKKGNLRFSEDLTGAIEKGLDRQRGTLECVLESVDPPEEDFQEDLKKALIKKTGAAEVRLLRRINPELLGGFRLRLGDEVLDASLRGQLKQMAAHLEAAPLEMDMAGAAGGN
jgi:F-type H+-transporting ATPase subunit delta